MYVLINIKKLFFFLFAFLFVASCGDDSELVNDGVAQEAEHGIVDEPSTQVYVQGQNISVLAESVTPTATDKAYFYIRVDSRIPECGSMPPSKYFPQTAGGWSIFANGNEGLIDLNYPYKSGAEYGYSGYVYDTEGKATKNAIVEEPVLSDLLNANQNYTWADLSTIDTDTLKVMWYIVKKEAGVWHVDGVLTGVHTKNIVKIPGITKDENLDETTVPDVTPTPVTPEDGKNVEVDIHQQKHSEWDEIKTSIHIRDLVDKVTVEIPIGRDYMAEADDFAIREYTFFTSLHHLNTSHPIKVTVKHEADKMVLDVVCTDNSYIEYLKKTYGDGVTIEVHSYTKNTSKEDVWALLKKSTVSASPATTIIYNGPTSAFFTE